MRLKKLSKELVSRQYVYVLKYAGEKLYYNNKILKDLRGSLREALVFKTKEDLEEFFGRSSPVFQNQRKFRICKIDVTFENPFA